MTAARSTVDIAKLLLLYLLIETGPPSFTYIQHNTLLPLDTFDDLILLIMYRDLRPLAWPWYHA
jgi:hypothetical protein